MFYYYAPDRKTVTASDLRELNLSHIVDADSDLVCREVMKGPNGQPAGVVFGSKKSINENSLGFYPDQQWQTFKAFSIGRRDIKIESLFRNDDSLSYHPWQDSQSQSWKIPIARKWAAIEDQIGYRCNLPQCVQYEEETDRWRLSGILDRYQDLWEIAIEFYNSRTNAIADAQESNSEVFQYKLPEFDAVCESVFKTAYRVSKYEMSILKAFTETTLVEVMRLVIDDPGFDELQKKTLLVDGNTLSGVEPS